MDKDTPPNRLQYGARIRLVASNEEELLQKYGTDLHEGGMFVRHDRPPAVETLVLVEIAPPEGTSVLSRIVGRVQHSRPATFPGEATAGMQLRFTELDEVAKRVAQIAAERAPLKVKSEPEPSTQFRNFTVGKSEQRALLNVQGPVIGIDLGTVNTCVAVVGKDGPRVITSKEGYETVPSVVFVGTDNQVVVGHKALEKMILEPTRGIHGSKRFLGRPFASKEVRSLGHFFNYGLVAGATGRTAAQVGDTVIPLEEVSGFILRAARQMAESHLGREVGRAVVTVPAYFGETQRQAVRDAAKLAGLYVERIINEPTAAAVAYGHGRALQRTILVYDLGGGTFDASLLRINGDTLEVLATDGDPFLGGADFDDRMLEYVLMTFQRTNGVNLRENTVAVQRLRFAVQLTKHQLSEVDVAPLDVPYVAQHNGKQVDVQMKFERKLLEDLTRDLVDRTLAIVESVLKEAKVSSADLDDVLLVGGQSRSPHVRRTLVERFNRKPSNAVHPDQAVALGAALVADAMQQHRPVHLTDVLPASIRMGVAEGKTAVLLTKGARLPAAKHFEIAAPNDQAEFKVVLCRGEQAMLQQNTLLGMLKLPSNQAMGTTQKKAQVTVQVSAEGLLSVIARHPVSGQAQELEVSLAEG